MIMIAMVMANAGAMIMIMPRFVAMVVSVFIVAVLVMAMVIAMIGIGSFCRGGAGGGILAAGKCRKTDRSEECQGQMKRFESHGMLAR